MIDAFTMFVLEKENYLGAREEKIQKIIQDFQDREIETPSQKQIIEAVARYHLGFLSSKEKTTIYNAIKPA